MNDFENAVRSNIGVEFFHQWTAEVRLFSYVFLIFFRSLRGSENSFLKNKECSISIRKDRGEDLSSWNFSKPQYPVKSLH